MIACMAIAVLGATFQNQDPIEMPGFLGVTRWWLTRDRGLWREEPNAPVGPRPPERVPQMRITWVNHATVLLQMDGVNILTDPMWSERASPVSFAGPKRVRPPGLRFEDLPPIDVVLVSHDHYDHMDLDTLARLQEKHRPRFFVGLGNAGRFDGNVNELQWWQSAEIAPGVTLTSVPAQHFSGRGLFDRDQTLWMGFVVRGPSGVAYFAGDTGFGRHFAEIRERFGPPRLSVLPIGAYLPPWIMKPVHVSPAEAVRAHQVLGSGTSVAIHFGTFELADDDQDQPVADLKTALDAAGVDRFWVLGFGEGRDVPELSAGTARTPD